MLRPILILAFSALSLTATFGNDAPTLEIVWPPAGATAELGSDAEMAIGVVVKSERQDEIR